MIVGQDGRVFSQCRLGSGKTERGTSSATRSAPSALTQVGGRWLYAFIFCFLSTRLWEKIDRRVLVRVGSERRIGKTFTDTQAATEILKTLNKPLSTESPLVKYLFIGANNEVDWNSIHMSLQFEDVADCLVFAATQVLNSFF